jgi:hypothetical protein
MGGRQVTLHDDRPHGGYDAEVEAQRQDDWDAFQAQLDALHAADYAHIYGGKPAANGDDDEYRPPSDWDEEEPPPAGDPTTWEPVDLAAALANKEPERPQLLARTDGHCLLYPGRLHSFNGENESLKTWLALLAVRQVLDSGLRAMFVDFEDNEHGIVGRLRALGVPDLAISDQFWYLRPERPMWVAAEQVAQLFDDVRPALVVIDGVTEAMAVHGLDPLDNVEIAKFYAAVPKRFSKAGAATVDIDHVTKDAATRGRFPLGGQAKLAGIDGAAYTVDALTIFAKGRTGKSRVTIAKDRLGGVRENAAGGKTAGELTLASLPDGSVEAHLDPVAGIDADHPFQPTKLMERISRAIEQQAGLSRSAIRATVKGNNPAKDLALELLVARGYVVVDKGPRGSALHRSDSPYREPTGQEEADREQF